MVELIGFDTPHSLDLDLPLEVDDEYWEHEDPEMAFRQPEGKPALVSAFVQWIKLSHIIAYALKTLVCMGGLSEISLNRLMSCFCPLVYDEPIDSRAWDDGRTVEGGER